MSYEVIIHPGALREFDKLPKDAQKRLAAVIDDLEDDPRPLGTVKLADVDAYRIRIGTFRIVYAVRDERLVILVLKFGHRKDIYKDIETVRRRLKE
ncbi:MAG: type II toxin-antitoxin system RelE family toxin [Armatimonadota bacterium]